MRAGFIGQVGRDGVRIEKGRHHKQGADLVVLGEADGTRTRNHQIDSLGL